MSNKTGTYDPNKLTTNFRRKNFYLDYGSAFYRVLPPFGSLASNNQIAKYWEVYWVEGTNGKRPITSLLKTKGKGKDKVILQRCPMYDKIEALKAALAAEEARKGSNDPTVAIMSEKINKDLRIDKAYYLNVMNANNEIGVLKLRPTAYAALRGRLEELNKLKIDPINAGATNGLFFEFKKTLIQESGKTEYSVDIAQTIVQTATGIQGQYKVAPIDDTVLARMEREASDLGELFKIPTAEEMALIATLDPKAIDRVFARPAEVTAAEEGLDEEDELPTESIVVSQAVPVQTVLAQVAPAVATPVLAPSVALVTSTKVTAPQVQVQAPVQTAPAADLKNLPGYDQIQAFLLGNKGQAAK